MAYGNLGWRETRGAGKSTTTLVDRPRPAPEERPAVVAPSLTSALIPRLVVVITALYALTFAYLSIQQHLSLQTNAFDLGNMDQAVWNTWQGRILEFSNWEGGTIRLAAHVEPILLLIAQAYWIYPSPITLLVIQSVVISLGALPAFWLARAKLQHDVAALAFAAAYLLSPALEIANLADFHAVALASSFLLYAFYFAFKGWYVPFLLAAILAMSTKEQVPLTVALMGVYILIAKRNWWVGVATIAISAVWFVVAVYVVIPAFNPAGVTPYLSRYDHLGPGPREIAMRILSDPGGMLPILLGPDRVAYLQGLFEPVAYLALLSPLILLAAPDIAINVLSNFDRMYSGQAHYGAVIAPLVIISGIYGAWFLTRPIQRLDRRVGNVVLYVVAALVLVASVRAYWVEVFLPMTDHLPRVTERDRVVDEFITLIPPEAGVSASSSVNPHVAHRQRLFLFPDVRDAEYIFIDVLGNPFPIDRATQRFRIKQLVEEQKAYGVVAAHSGFVLLRKGAPNYVIPDDVISFARVAQPRGDRLDVDFGNLRLLSWELSPGTTLHGDHPYATVSTYWTVNGPLDRPYLPTLYLVKPDGGVAFTDAYPPASAWVPVERWQRGQVMRVDFPVVPLHDDRGLLALGVSTRNDKGELTGRIRATPPASGAELGADRTLVVLDELRRSQPARDTLLEKLANATNAIPR
jgi:uncharacterized membrane protein